MGRWAWTGGGSLRTSWAAYRSDPDGFVPSNIPRMMTTASSSQRRRSPGDAPNSSPKSWCSSSFQAAPMPQIIRPPLMMSSWVTILAVRAGLRNGFAPTMRPIRIRLVAAAQPARLR